MADLLGRRVRLVPVGPAEQEYVFQLERHPALITRWRGRGMVLSPSEAARTFWAGCAAAFVVVGVDSGPVGCVHLSNFEPVNGCCMNLFTQTGRGGGLCGHRWFAPV